MWWLEEDLKNRSALPKWAANHREEASLKHSAARQMAEGVVTCDKRKAIGDQTQPSGSLLTHRKETPILYISSELGFTTDSNSVNLNQNSSLKGIGRGCRVLLHESYAIVVGVLCGSKA